MRISTSHRGLSLAFSFLLSTTPVLGQTTVIHAGTLIAEPGKPAQHKKSILIKDGKIVAIEDGFVAADKVIDLSAKYVLPGLIDMHTHITAPKKFDDDAPLNWISQLYTQRQSISALNAVPVLKAMLLNGFTTIRNLGDPASVTYDLRDAVNSGKIDGPRMLVSEVQFETAGGTYDPSTFKASREIEPFLQSRGKCNGADDCRRAVREEVKRGADVIKLRLADLPAVDSRVASVEQVEEIQSIVDTAHRLGRTVAVHTAGVTKETMLAINAGVDTIEHGPIDPAVISAMKSKNMSFTPTLSTYIMSEPLMKHLGIKRDYVGETKSSIRNAHNAGIPIIYGTDYPVVPIDKQAMEFSALVDAGLTPAEALASATTNAARALHMEDQIGSIGPGKAADIIAVDADPMTDSHALETVPFVMKGGLVITR